MDVRRVVLIAAATLWASLAHGQGLTTQRTCGKTAFANATTATTTQLAPPTSGPGSLLTTPLYICGYAIVVAAADNVQFVYGTGTNCATGTTNISPNFNFAGAASFADGAPVFRGMDVPAGNNLCVVTSTTANAAIMVYYDQNPL